MKWGLNESKILIVLQVANSGLLATCSFNWEKLISWNKIINGNFFGPKLSIHWSLLLKWELFS